MLIYHKVVRKAVDSPKQQVPTVVWLEEQGDVLFITLSGEEIYPRLIGCYFKVHREKAIEDAVSYAALSVSELIGLPHLSIHQGETNETLEGSRLLS